MTDPLTDPQADPQADPASRAKAAYEAEAHLPTSPDALLARLAALGIESRTFEHPPVFTVEESRSLRGDLPGAHVKNLFLRNKKEAMWLVTLAEDKRVDLKALGERLGAGKLSFGSPARLMERLGVIAGAVTPFAIINDKAGLVQSVLDRGLLAHDFVNAHPLVNYRSTALRPQDLIRFLEAEGHPPLLLDF